VIVAPAAFGGRQITVGEFERRGGLLVVRIDRRDGEALRPGAADVIRPGDGLVVISRAGVPSLEAIVC